MPVNTELKGPPPPLNGTAPRTQVLVSSSYSSPQQGEGASTKKKLTIFRKDLLILTFGNFSTKRLLDHQLVRPVHTYSFLVSTL